MLELLLIPQERDAVWENDKNREPLISQGFPDLWSIADSNR